LVETPAEEETSYTYIIVETPVTITEYFEILEGIVCGKVFELHEQFGEDLLHRFHKFLHEVVHLMFAQLGPTVIFVQIGI
jgi:hypothetical protein